MQRIPSRDAPLEASRSPSWMNKISSENWTPAIRAMAVAVKASTATEARVVRFSLGVPVGLLLSALASALLAPSFPLTAPMAFFLTVSLTIATGIFFAAGFPLRDAFTTEERRMLERVDILYRKQMNALSERVAEMRDNGMAGPEIEARIGPERDRVIGELRSALQKIQLPESVAHSALENDEP